MEKQKLPPQRLRGCAAIAALLLALAASAAGAADSPTGRTLAAVDEFTPKVVGGTNAPLER